MLVDLVWDILIIEDDEDDYLLTKHMLGKMRGRKPQLDWASDFEEGQKKLAEGCYDAVFYPELECSKIETNYHLVMEKRQPVKFEMYGG
jgi:hypothetical protein